VALALLPPAIAAGAAPAAPYREASEVIELEVAAPTGAQAVAQLLAERAVPYAFEVSGGTIGHLLDALHVDGRVRVVSMRHEQSAAFAADACGRLTGRPGVALATSGPGAINLLTGVGSCYFDSSPAVFLTGQVNRHELKGALGVRQLGFQEADVVAMAEPVTKAAWRALRPPDVPRLVADAFALAVDRRPGPVLVDLPMDLQSAAVDGDGAAWPERAREPADAEAVARVLDAIGRARRPLALVGGGVRSAGAAGELRRLVETAGLPVVHSLMGLDALPAAHALRVGMIGTYGNRWANMALARSDCLVVLGSRLDIRQTGADTDAFGARDIRHVDCDAAEINARVTGCHGVVADLKAFLEAAAAGAEPLELRAWHAEIDALRHRWPDTAELRGIAGINPNALMHRLSSASKLAGAYVADVGQHQMWAAQSLALARGQRFVTSGGLGAMGSGLPLAIGAAFACGAPVVLVAGDGGLQLSIGELQTVVHHRLPVKIVVLDNGGHGMVRQFQRSYFDGRLQSSEWGYSAPDFTQVARAYGIRAHAVRDPGEVDAALAGLWADPDAPALLQVAVDPRANAYPKIAFGRPLDEMEPDAAPLPLGAARP
jgi:acetolactate synthase I/II/III large subunit